MSAVVTDRGTVQAITSLAMATRQRLNFLTTSQACSNPKGGLPPSVTAHRKCRESMGVARRLFDGVLARQEGFPYWLDSSTPQAVGAVQGCEATSAARLPWTAP